jgi:hypothetical protein
VTYVMAWSSRTKAVTYKDEDGKEWIRQEGSRSWRNFNPGNISKGSFAESCGSIGGDTRFAIFPDEDTGLEAIGALFRTRSYRDLTLEGAIFRYAPPGENDSPAYVRAVAKKVGCPPSTIVKTLSEQQFGLLAEAIKIHEGWKAGTQRAANGVAPAALMARMDEAPIAAVPAAGEHSDKQCIPRLIELGGDVESLHRIQDVAATTMRRNGYGYTMHNACAATLSAFLQAAGIAVQTTLGAGRLARRLSNERHWDRVAVGNQAAGDVGVAAGDVHIYLVVKTEGRDEMTIADNQKPTPHTRFASGRGKTRTAYFLRAPADHPHPMAAALDTGRESVEDDAQDFYPSEDEDTSGLIEPSTDDNI